MSLVDSFLNNKTINSSIWVWFSHLGPRLTSSAGKHRTIFRAISLVIARSVRNHSLFNMWALTSLHIKTEITSCWSTRYQNINKKQVRYWKFPTSLPILANVLVSVSIFVFTFATAVWLANLIFYHGLSNFLHQVPYSIW